MIAASAEDGSGVVGEGECVRSVNAARRRWGWGCERSGAVKEAGTVIFRDSRVASD